MVSTRLADAIMYELWVGSDGTSARTIYYSGLPWLIGKALFMKQREAEVTLLSLMIFFCNLSISDLRTYTSVRKPTVLSIFKDERVRQFFGSVLCQGWFGLIWVTIDFFKG
jgi:hypothetical protein